jgi:phenylalanyl-tRNA synthetase alpha chain
MILEKIAALTLEVNGFSAQGREEVESARIRWLGRKGEITLLFDAFREVPVDQKKEVGRQLNALKALAQEKIDALAEQHDGSNDTGQEDDLTLPGSPLLQVGSRHPLSVIRRRMIEIFSHIGFTVSEGKEIAKERRSRTTGTISRR